MKFVLITGGAGYIGSHTCKLLANSGYTPITYDDLSTGHKDFVKWGDLVVGDLNDTDKLTRTLNTYNPIAVIHFAASAYVGESIENPFKYYKNNVGGTISLLDAMRKAGVKHLVFSSTCATYGLTEGWGIKENTPQNPINPYGRSKLMVEEILRDLSFRGEMNYVALRYFNAAGADGNAEIGEMHKPETHLIPLAIQSAFGGPVLKIFGTSFLTQDGTAIRDFIHVEDLALGHLRALEYLLSGGISDQVNLGTGNGTSVFEIITALKGIGVNVLYENVPKREGDPSHLVADTTKARDLFGWSAKYTDIRDTLLTALKWHEKNGF